MTKETLELKEIKKYLESMDIGNLLSNIILEDKILNIIIDQPNGVNIDQEKITKEIKHIVSKNYKEIKDTRVIFSGDKEIKPISNKRKIPNVKKIILFAAAKGGVGKSTTAANAAIALAKLGYKIGLVDADIYGPTIPRLLGIQQKPDISDGKMLPIKKHGIYSISIGYIVDEAQAAIWRGPMISKTLYQLLIGVNWPELDYLIIDMPPGTGDIYLSLAENFIIDGAILVTTPQNIASSMLKKSISFFNKTNIKILGVIENMSYFVDEQGQKHFIFGKSNAEDITKKLEIKLLETITLMQKISSFSDQGLSLVNEKEFYIYENIAKIILQ